MSAEVVWLASYPKSGNTWFRLLLANWRRGGAEALQINALNQDSDEVWQRGAFDNSTLLASGLLRSDELDRMRPSVYEWLAQESSGRLYVKVHDAYRHAGDGTALFAGAFVRGAVYLVRDPRDVAVSFASHADMQIDRVIGLMESPLAALAAASTSQPRHLRQVLCDWSGHIASWLAQREVPVHLLRYEDLLADTAGAFESALRSCGEQPLREDVERAVRHCSFAALQRQEEQSGFCERGSDKALFFRRGRAGGWKSVLSAAQAARIERAHAEWMVRLGYLEASGASAQTAAQPEHGAQRVVEKEERVGQGQLVEVARAQQGEAPGLGLGPATQVARVAPAGEPA